MLAAPSSRQQFVIIRDIAAEPAKVFEHLTSEAGMKAWIPLCKSAQWRHAGQARGPGVDSVRQIRLHGGSVADERVLAWKAGRELHYSFDRTTFPVVGLTRNYVGVTRIDKAGRGRSRLTWAVHYDTPGVLQLSRPLVSPGLKLLIATMAGNLKALSERK